jgi:hypothetical protein
VISSVSLSGGVDRGLERSGFSCTVDDRYGASLRGERDHRR